MKEFIKLRELVHNSVWLVLPPVVITTKLCIRAEWWGNEKHSFEMCFSHQEILNTSFPTAKIFAEHVNEEFERTMSKEKDILR